MRPPSALTDSGSLGEGREERVTEQLRVAAQQAQLGPLASCPTQPWLARDDAVKKWGRGREERSLLSSGLLRREGAHVAMMSSWHGTSSSANLDK